MQGDGLENEAKDRLETSTAINVRLHMNYRSSAIYVLSVWKSGWKDTAVDF